MARTEIAEFDNLTVGQIVEVVTTYDDGSEHVYKGQVSDHEYQTELVSLLDLDTAEVTTKYWSASDEEERHWFELTEDEVPLVDEQEIGLAAADYVVLRDEMLNKHAVENRVKAEKDRAELEELTNKYRDIKNSI